MSEVKQSICSVSHITHDCYNLEQTNCNNPTKHNHSDDHSHDHNHSHPSHLGHHHGLDLEKVNLKLKISTFVTVLFVVIQVAAGLYTNSIALVSDAVHNFTDALSLIIALFSIWLQKRPVSLSKTYGYNRAGILAAFINSSSLMVIVAFLCYESIERLFNPRQVETHTMFWVAIVGLIINIGIGLALHKDSQHDITIRSAYIHMLGDAASTVGIIIGSIAIYYTGYMIIDPIISLGISALILWTSWDILQETVHLLLEGTPKGISVDNVSKAIETVPGVQAVHHIHIWAIASQVTALSCHIRVNDMNLSNCQDLLLRINTILKDNFQINHTTLQFETSSDKD
ncbi:MAG: cation diffusion facilitator family transporter [Blastocatellia bacterium]